MIAFSPFQFAVGLLIVVAHIALAYVLGVWQGRLREACEPSEKPAEDNGETLRAFGRGGHS